jgi:hypothetical protein
VVRVILACEFLAQRLPADTFVLLGSSTDNESRTQDGHKGPDSEHFKENISSQQSEVSARVVRGVQRMKANVFGQPVWPAKFNEIQYNNPKGK